MTNEAADNVRLLGVTPILFVRNVEAAAGYYRDKLGFAVDFLHGYPCFYGSVSRGGVCLHLRHVDSPNFAELAGREESLILATIEVAEIMTLFADCDERGADIVQRPTVQSWGGIDFQVRDPDGNRISFVSFQAEDKAG